ncbi:MAG: EAL domain-containing protein [Colwellia sp.]
MSQMNNKNKLAANFIVLLFIGLLASSMVAYQHVKGWQERAIQDELRLNASLVSTQLNSWVDQMLNRVENFAIFLATSAESLQDHPNYQHYLEQYPKRGGLEDLGYALESDGYYSSEDWQVPEGYDPRQRSWYIEGKAAKRPIIGLPYISVNDTPRMELAVTSPIIVEGQFLGLASAFIALDVVQNSLDDIDLDTKGHAFLIDQQGRVIVHQDSQQLGSLWSGFENIKDGSSGLMQTLESPTKLFFISRQNSKLGWLLVFAIPKDAIEDELLLGALHLLGKFLIIFILVLFGLYLSNRHLLSPLFDYMELDSITLLPGKKHFKKQLIDKFLLPGKKGKLLIINIDNFNRLTATYPAAQIHLLQNKIKERIQSVLHDKALLGNFSESRYIVYYNCDDALSIYNIDDFLRKLSDVLAEQYPVAGREINCSFRIGTSAYPEHGEEIESLIDNAFSALANVRRYQDKNYSIFSPAINQQFSDEQFIHNAMNNAIRTAEFTMAYQPQIDSNTGKMFAVESLIRWHSSELERTVSPAEFIPIAESSGLMVLLGDYIIELVFKQISFWNKQGLEFGVASINISPSQLLAEDFYSKLQQSISLHKVSPKQVEFEITETSVLKNPMATIGVLRKLKADGFSIAIDDFGTGYSSLEYLNIMPLDKLKIDRAFVVDLDKEQKSAVLVKTIIAMAKNLNLDILAEGAERKEEVDALADLGCHKIQGYFYSKPLSPEVLLDFIQENTSNQQTYQSV